MGSTCVVKRCPKQQKIEKMKGDVIEIHHVTKENELWKWDPPFM